MGLRVHEDDEELVDIGIFTHYKGKPFTGIMFHTMMRTAVRLKPQYEKYEVECMCEHNMVNGLKEGRYTEHWPDGSLRVEQHYKNDMRNGETKIYFIDGVLSETINYLDDKLHGINKNYEYDGTLTSEINYKNGKQSGISKWYDEDGKLEQVSEYYNGVLLSH